jgi:hypothetical protein
MRLLLISLLLLGGCSVTSFKTGDCVAIEDKNRTGQVGRISQLERYYAVIESSNAVYIRAYWQIYAVPEKYCGQ